MIRKPIHDIRLRDLDALVSDSVAESETIEYKREMPGGSRDEKIKFLAAVSSFANTAGGDLLVGVTAQDGIPAKISGIAVPSIDDEKLRLENLLADCIEPRIPRTEIAAIPCSGGQHTLVVRVHRSWLAPHRVRLNDKFYGRNSAGKYPLDVSELRSAFVQSDTTAERMRAFRTERLIKIAARENFIPLPDAPVMVVHAIPFETFATGRQIDPYETLRDANVLPMPPGRQHGDAPQTHVTFDGFSIIARPSGGKTHAYAQLFRTGALEGVTTVGGDETKHYLHAMTFENTAVAAIRNYLSVLQALDMGLPVVIFLSFCGMSRCYFRIPAEIGGGVYDRDPLRLDTVALPEIIFDTKPAVVPAAMRTAFNTVWNGFGYAKSEMYDDRGEWRGVG